MKKILIAIILLLALPAASYALVVDSISPNIARQQDIVDMLPLYLTAEADGEISAEHGINIMINRDKRYLWERVDQITATGSAVDAGRMAATITPVFSDDYRTVYVPVLNDFIADEQVVLEGLKMRTYDKDTASSFLMVDIDGDGIIDENDLNVFFVNDSFKRIDDIIPYPVINFKVEVAEDLKSVHLSWQNPPDWDFLGSSVGRLRVRDGFHQDIAVVDRKSVTEYTDNDIRVGDQMTYTIVAQDLYNASEPLSITVTIGEDNEPEPEPDPIPEDEPAPDPNIDQEELDLLNRLYNYYQLRQAIKCLRDDSACLWAKINLIYTQEVLNRFEVNSSLSERDLYLMGIRIKYTEGRFQRNCIEAEEPAKTCNALGRSIKRSRYFLDQQ